MGLRQRARAHHPRDRAVRLARRHGTRAGPGAELVDGKLRGIAVVIGARVAADAEPGEILVTSTVRDLVAGAGIEFTERAALELKGVPGTWRLYSVLPSGR